MRKKQTGKIIRISEQLENILDKKRKTDETYDAILRKCLGVADRSGTTHPVPHLVFSFWVYVDGDKPFSFLTKAEAEGYAIQAAVRAGKKKTARIIYVQEVV